MKSIFLFLAAALLLLAAAPLPAPGQQAGPPPGSEDGCLMLDPGHGGPDRGAAIAGGVQEKDATLAFSRRLSAFLAPDFRVKKTRDADFGLSLADRAGTANNARAALFLSIHAGMGWAAESDRVFVYVDGGAAAEPGIGPASWERLQAAHRQESRRLAELVRQALAASDTGLSCEVRELPMPVLAGADMPAVLVDLPLPRLAPSKAREQEALARALAGAVKKYLPPGPEQN